MKQHVLVLAGALVGGLIGHFAFLWMLRQGYYAMILPGGLLGLGAGWTRNRSRVLAVICGVLALGLGLVSEWRGFPFAADPSWGFFLKHVGDLQPITMLMIGVGAFIGFWIPFRRIEPTAAAGQNSHNPR